jgi:hypothetical protein
MNKFKLMLCAAAALGGLALTAGTASALPMSGLDSAVSGETADIQQARTVCNQWGRCWWVPGPRYYGRGYGYGHRRHFYGHRHYRRW